MTANRPDSTLPETNQPARRAVEETSPAPHADTTVVADLGHIIGRIPVSKVSPVIEGGAYSAKATEGERIPIRATVLREGHDSVNAAVILTDPDGVEHRVDMAPGEPVGFDRWEAYVRPDRPGNWTFRIEGWDDPWATWLHHAEIKLPVGLDVALVLAEGKQLYAEAAAAARQTGDEAATRRLEQLEPLCDPDSPVGDRLEQLTHRDVRALMTKYGPRRLVTPTPDYPLFVDRRRALFSAWYEFFPRSQGARYDQENKRWISGGFDSSH